MKISTETGLPELPRGYFWNVRKDWDGEYRVELKRGYSIFSVVVVWRWFSAGDLSPYRIQYLAGEIYNTFTERASTRKLERDLLGSYPPRRIGKDV